MSHGPHDVRWRAHQRYRKALAFDRAMRSARPVARRRLVRGALVVADVPFVETQGSKRRHSVVAEVRGGGVLIVPCYTLRDRQVRGDIFIEAWSTAGFTRPTVLRVSRTCLVPFAAIVEIKPGHRFLVDLLPQNAVVID